MTNDWAMAATAVGGLIGIALTIFALAWWDTQTIKQKAELIKQVVEAKKQGIDIKIGDEDE